MDCEGAELDILTKDVVPLFTKTHLLVELHDLHRAGCSRIIWQRYEKTHNMKFISNLPRNPDDFIILKGLNPRQKHLALDEARMGSQEWVLMSPKR